MESSRFTTIALALALALTPTLTFADTSQHETSGERTLSPEEDWETEGPSIADSDKWTPDSSQSLSELTGVKDADDIALQYDLESIEVIEPGTFNRIDVHSGDEVNSSGLQSRSSSINSCVAPAGKQFSCRDKTGHMVMANLKSKMTMGYSWSVHWSSGSNANVLGRGFQGGTLVWRGGGNAKSGSFNVPWYRTSPYSKPGWGEAIMSTKHVKVRSMNPPAGVSVNWQ